MAAALRRVVQAGLVAVLVTTLSFFLIQLAPGDPFAAALAENPDADPAVVAELRAQYGLDRPLPEQYARWLAGVVRGDLGRRVSGHESVAEAIADHLPNTLLLMGTALTLSFALGVALGVVQATRPGSRFDRVTRALSLAFHSMPSFWLAAVLLIVFAKGLELFPVAGAAHPLARYQDALWQLLDRLHRLVLPALTLVLLSTAYVARLQRSALLDTLPDEYVRTAVAKGLDPRRVVLRHALRNALLPVITLVGLALPALLGGAVFVEHVYAYQGMGHLIVEAVGKRDYLLLTGCVLVGSLLVVIGSLLADLLSLLADPRQRAT